MKQIEFSDILLISKTDLASHRYRNDGHGFALAYRPALDTRRPSFTKDPV